MKRDTIIQLGAVALVAASLVVSGGFASAIANSAGRNQLTYADTAEEGDPPEVALGIAMGAFRGVFVNFLWYRANDLKEKGQYYEAMELARAITKLQPRFPQVWVFHAWNMAYNISVSTQTPSERWQWVQAGIRLLRNEGIKANPNDLLIHKELAWIFLHKVAGITDDANQFYKRKLAEEWTIVLGDPPARSPADRDRQGAIDQYVAWLQPIVDAPETLEGLTGANPKAAELLQKIREITGEEPYIDTLRRYVSHIAMRKSIYRAQAEKSMGENNKAFAALIDNPEYAQTWPALLAHMRKRVLIDDYNMEPARMVRYTKKYGPIDWRHPAAHALYWSARGVEESLTRWTEANKRDFDFINADRVTIQALQELYRSGDVYFNFFDSIAGAERPYQLAPNANFAESYGNVLKEVTQRSWADNTQKRAYTIYSAGYENFLKDAVRFFYRRGQMDLADKYYRELGTFPGQNLNNPYQDMVNSVPLDEFVLQELQDDRIRSSYVLVSEVVGALQGAYIGGLLGGDDELFRKNFEWAGQAHKYYLETQVRETVAAQGDPRVLVLDRDFRIVAGDMFARTIQLLNIDDAASMFGRAPLDLQQFAYDFLAAAWKPSIDELAAKGQGKPFGVLFPEPAGMPEHRAWLARVAEERKAKQIDIEQK
ncbi:MAG: hypothetical protein IPJ41_12720 [Phycisphaerales bacterium]|nr:hypothetical protein [Phycisphaerales bacterium]